MDPDREPDDSDSSKHSSQCNMCTGIHNSVTSMSCCLTSDWAWLDMYICAWVFIYWSTHVHTQAIDMYIEIQYCVVLQCASNRYPDSSVAESSDNGSNSSWGSVPVSSMPLAVLLGGMLNDADLLCRYVVYCIEPKQIVKCWGIYMQWKCACQHGSWI